MTEYKVELQGIAKTIDGLETIKDISLYLAEKEIVVILGPSGCGKSTLLHITAGLIAPDAGSIKIEGKDWTGRTGRVGYMQQKSLLLPFATVMDNICLPLIIGGNSREAARREAAPYINYFGLTGFESYYPGQLSGGMQQRAALLRTFLFSQDIMLLDEPFASLDAITRRRMQLWLGELQHLFGSSILFVTHDIDEALLIGDRLYVLTARPARVRKEILLNRDDRNEINDIEIKRQILDLLQG